MPINSPSMGGKLNSQSESGEAPGGKQVWWHTHIHEFHTGTRMRKYKNMGSHIQTHAGLTPETTCRLETPSLILCAACQKGVQAR